jgi:predicted DNA-binding protein (MmcQ/YjbR family)
LREAVFNIGEVAVNRAVTAHRSRSSASLRGGGYDVPMNTEQLKNFCDRLPGAEATLHGAPANILVYAVGGKRFAHFKTSSPERWRFSIKVTPERFVELTDVPGIKPARWLGRYRWITIVDVASVPTAYLSELVRWSYEHALATLSKARRADALKVSGP